MIDTSSQQPIYEAIKATAKDNHKLWATAGDIYRQFNKQRKIIKQLQHDAQKLQLNKQMGLEPLGADATDDELRARAKLVLINKLNDESISAAEFAQFKDIFGLASKVDDMRVEVVSFAEVVIDCPGCGRNVYAPRDVVTGNAGCDACDSSVDPSVDT